MKTRLALKTLLPASLLAITLTVNLNSLAPLIWMSGVGDDTNPGSRTAPALTLTGALGKVAAGGQISALDPGDFGPATIETAVTIDGTSIPAEIFQTAMGTGIIIAAGPMDVVILRHLFLNGTGLGTTGIQFNSGKQLIIEDCKIIGFTGTGIDISLSAAGNVVIRNTSISNVTTGISVAGMISPVNVSLDNVSIQDTTSAVDALFGNIDIANSFILQNTNGVIGDGTSVVSCSNTLFASNSIAIQSTMGATVRISNNDFYDNTTGIDNTGGGVVATANNNREAGSTTPGSPTTPIVFQ